MDRQSFLNSALEASSLGGEVLKKYWGKVKNIQHKADVGDLVTEADKESEHVILEYIKKKYPSHAILSEETGRSTHKDAEFLWVIDPLDGTTNYTHQFPFVAVSIGLVHQGKPIVGVVYNPILNELFEAAEGTSAKLNGNEIKVSRVESLGSSLLATGFSYDRKDIEDNNYAEFAHLLNKCQGVRRAGAAALDLAYVAAGRLDAYWERGIKEWDMAAGIVLVREAGGVVTSYDKSPIDISLGRILASNGLIHEEISQELLHVKSTRSKEREWRM